MTQVRRRELLASVGLLLASCATEPPPGQPIGPGSSGHPTVTACDLSGLPEPRVVAPEELPGALYDPNATSLPVISVELTSAQWAIFCQDGVDTRAAYLANAAPSHVFASTSFGLGDEVLGDVGMRIGGRSTVINLFDPQPGETADAPYQRCLDALAGDSVRYDPDTQTGSFVFKPSFKLDFKTFVAGRHFHGQGRLNLVGESGWASMLDEWLPNNLYAQAGIASVRTGHAALCINGVYRGVYQVEEQVDDQAWLDQHFPGLDPAGDGAFFKIDPYGPLTYSSTITADYARQYEPRAGTTDADLADLVDLLKVGTFDTRLDDAAFQAEMANRIDLDHWLTLLGVEMVLGDVDGVMSSNNFVIVRRADQRWEPARYDPDGSFYPWIWTGEPAFEDWPGMSAERGPSLLCLRPLWDHAQPNCSDGTAPVDPLHPKHNVQVRHSVLAARLLHSYRTQYLAKVDELISTVLDPANVLDMIDTRAALLQPWIGVAEGPRLDPWGSDYYSWYWAVFGDDLPTSGDECRSPDRSCTLRQTAAFYLDEAAIQLAGIRSGAMPNECFRDEPDQPSYASLLACP